MIVLKKTIFVLILLSASLAHAQTSPFVGSYRHTEMEFAEQMHILKPHRFSWQQVYGAVNRDIRGKWKVKKDMLHLVLDPLPNKKQPGELVAVLTDTGNLKLVKAFGKTIKDPKFLERFEKTLPPEKAAAWAKPIDYKKLKAEAKKRKKQRQQEREKEKLRYGRYDGYFENREKTIAISLYGRENQFVGKKINSEKPGKYIYFQGSFQIKNDTAYATTYTDDDQIKVFGNRIDAVPKGKVNLYLRDLNPKNIKVKIGNTYANAGFISSKKFNDPNKRLSSVRLKKADSLWVAVGKKEPIVYGFGIKRMKSNAILIQPNPTHIETWLNHPIYVTKKNEIHGLLSDKTVLKRKPGKRIPSPVGMAPGYPTLHGKNYYSIQRDRIFSLQKNE